MTSDSSSATTSHQPVVDAHVHLGRSAYGEKIELDTLLAMMDHNKVDQSVVSVFTPPDLDYARENHELAQAVRSYPDRLIGTVRVDPRNARSSREIVLRATEKDGFRCLALHP